VIPGKLHIEATPYKNSRPDDKACVSCALLGKGSGNLVPRFECMWRIQGIAARILDLGT
jgi:hypothetical protein